VRLRCVWTAWSGCGGQLPQALEFQNERQRIGWWFAASQDLFGARDNISIGFGHASATTGDPGGEHNYNLMAGRNTPARPQTWRLHRETVCLH